MNILEALKDRDNILRLEYEDRYLYWDDIFGNWVVRMAYGSYNSRVIIETEHEEEAVKALLDGALR